MISPSSPAPDGKPHEEPFGSGAGGEPAPDDSGATVASHSVAASPTLQVGDPVRAAAVSGEALAIPGKVSPDFLRGAPIGSGEAATASDYVPVRAMEDMLRIRHEQIHKFGHTLEADRQRPLNQWGQDLESIARAILEDIQFHKSPDRLRRRAIKLGALAMAFADRLEGED